jgi:glycolate oxidase
MEAERVHEIFTEFEALEIHTAQSAAERERLWNLRRLVSPSLSRLADGKMNEDVVVPIGQMGRLLQRTSEICGLYNIRIPVYGHAGDGNLHLNAMFDKTEPKQVRAAHEAIEKCFEEVVRLGGTITGEHGVGASKRREMKLQFSPEDLHVFREVKRAMDPDGLFNPHKLIPAE